MLATDWLQQLSLPANLAIFAAAGAGVWYAGSRLPVYADELSDRYRIGHAFMGLVLLATATSLPEIVTTVTGALAGAPRLVLNNMFGGIAMQTAILAVADAFAGRAPLTSYPRKPTSILESGVLVLLMALVLAVLTLGEVELVPGIGAGALVIGIAYGAAIYLLRRYDEEAVWAPVEILEATEEEMRMPGGRPLAEASRRQLIVAFALAGLAILVCGVALVASAEAIATQSGLGESFIGATLLAAVTSLPEVSVTIAAVRMGAYTMAISNIFGSNLLMLVLILPADILFRSGPILMFADRSAQFALVAGILTTSFFTCGLVLRSRFKLGIMGLDSVGVFAAYLATLFGFYVLR
jgi:cation:H+ antiporter